MVPEQLQRVHQRLSRSSSKTARCRMARIDDAVTRILRVKSAMGLLDPNRSPVGRPQRCTRPSVRPSIGQWPASAVRKSLVLLKNDEQRCSRSRKNVDAHPRRRQERRRHRQPMRRLDHRPGKARAATRPPAAPPSSQAFSRAVQPARRVTFSQGRQPAPRARTSASS